MASLLSLPPELQIEIVEYVGSQLRTYSLLCITLTL